MDKIAIIIVHYNTDDDTRETLASLAKLRAENLEVRIFVVDNASREPLVLNQSDRMYKDVRLIRSDANLGFSGGNNLGFETASREFEPDYFLLLNSDTLVDPDFLGNLYKSLSVHPRWGAVSPKIYFAPGCEFHQDAYKSRQRGQVIWFAGGSIDWDNLLTVHCGVDELDRGQFSQARTLDFASGCCLLIRREVLASAGVFDDRYFLYYEDTDLCERIKNQGFQIGFEPQAVIWHKNGGSTAGSGSDLQTFYQTRNRLLFFASYGDLWVKQRVWRFAWRLWCHGSRVEKLAVRAFWQRHFGKQVAI